MSKAPSRSFFSEPQNNAAQAASPQAIAAPGCHKLPIDDNDPTRNVSSRVAVVGLVLVALATAALLVLAVATIMLLRVG